MPRQGQSVESCIITRWHKSKGDSVKEGDLLFSYETDKAAFDEEVKESGILLDIFFCEGDEVPVLENIAVIGQKGDNYKELIPALHFSSSGKYDRAENCVGSENYAGRGADTGTERGPEVLAGSNKTDYPDKGFNDSGTKETRDTTFAESNINDLHKEGSADQKRRPVSPLARKIAYELNLSLYNIKGTGPKGRIIERDVRRVAAKIQAPAGEESPPYYKAAAGKPDNLFHGEDFTVYKLSNIRRIIADKMSASLQNSAQITNHMSADARKMLVWRNMIKAGKGPAGTADVSINAMVCYAVINALKKHSFMNAHFMGTSIRVFTKVHLGIAVDTERGLMVPVIRNADDMNVRGLAGSIVNMADKCRKGSVDPELLSSENASFTITNLGSYGVEMFTPVLNLPQVGILGVNTITYRPADIGDGVIGFIPMIGLSLTYDHRAVDGAPASVFLAAVRNEIENIDSHRI